MTSLQTQPVLPSTAGSSSTTPPSHQQHQPQPQPQPQLPQSPATGFMHQKSYSAYQFPIVKFNSPTPPSSDRKDYFDPLLDPKKMGRPLHQKAQSETCMRLDLPRPGPYSSSACTSASSSSCSFDTTPMLRKKSGEVVRSSLKFPSSSGSTATACSSRSNSYSNSRSAPSTPTQGGAKAVHFDTHLEHVRHFLSQQRPIAVSRDGSPIETETEGEEEYPFPDMMNHAPGSLHHQRSKLVIELPNMPLNPALSPDRHVCLNSLELAADGKNLKGTVLVQNLSFEKRVAVRFTFDKWQTVSEVTADYLRSQQTPHHHIKSHASISHHPSTDVFGFTIKLQDVLARIEEREMEIAVRYLAAGGEYWDNNFNQNYHVRFKNLRNGPPHGSAHQHKPTFQSPMSRSPTTTTTTTASIPNMNHHHHHHHGEANNDASWATTLRAELDRLVGDDLGVSSSMMMGAHGIVGLKKKKGGSASFSCVGTTAEQRSHHATLDALAAGSQLRSGTGLSARYDFGLSLKQAVRQQHDKNPNSNSRFHNNVLPLPLSPVPVEWLGLQPNNNTCSKLNDRSPEFLNPPSYTPPNSNSQHHPHAHQPQPQPQQYNGSQLYHAYTKRWSLPTSTPIALANLPPSPPQDLPSSSASSTSSTTTTTTTTVRNFATHDSSPVSHSPSLPVSSAAHRDTAVAVAAALPPHQPPPPFFSSGIFTPQSPSLTDDSI